MKDNDNNIINAFGREDNSGKGADDTAEAVHTYNIVLNDEAQTKLTVVGLMAITGAWLAIAQDQEFAFVSPIDQVKYAVIQEDVQL